MHRKEEILDAIRTIAREILPAGYRLRLFGSRARGDHRQDSDWDIHILIPGDQRLTLQQHADLSWPLEQKGWEMEEMITAWIYTYKDWEKRSFLPFYKNVEKDAIDL